MSVCATELFQIAYDTRTLAALEDSGFKLLDNMANARPDWFEYWPIRNFLLNQSLKSDVWYGFFSPRFQEKTGLDASGVKSVISSIEQRQPDLDVILFSPQPDMGAFFLNVFEQGEMFHPGLMATSRAVLARIGFDVPLGTLVMDSRQIVFSNYFVAKAEFWRAWLEVTESIFKFAEDPTDSDHRALNAGTSYKDGSHQKVFLIERIASLMLTVQKHWKAASADTFNFAWSAYEAFNFNRDLAYQSDALKVAFKECGHPHYMQAYAEIRRNIGSPTAEDPSKVAERIQVSSPSLKSKQSGAAGQRPLVSVVIPTYNRPALLARALGSVLAQDYPRIEVIVVNDGGSPVEEVVAQLDKQGAVRVVNMPNNSGAAKARNAGFRKARGEYIALLDDDDEYLRGHLSALVKALGGRIERFAYSRAEYLFEQEGQEPRRQFPFANLNYTRSLVEVGNFIPTPTWLFERSLLTEVGDFDESFMAWEDWEWLIRASAVTDFFALENVSVQVHQRVADGSHLGTKHRPQMREWFERVYALHPPSSATVQHTRQAYLASLFPPESELGELQALSNDERSEIGRQDVLTVVGQAEQMLRDGRWQQAASLYTDWLLHSSSPLRYAVAYNLGSLWNDRGNRLQALQCFSLSLELKPDFAPSHFAMGLQLELHGDLQAAAARYQWLIQTEHGVAVSHPDLYHAAIKKVYVTNP